MIIQNVLEKTVKKWGISDSKKCATDLSHLRGLRFEMYTS